MAVTITNAQWPTHRTNRIGPFEIGGNLYIIARENGTGDMVAWKSTDGGGSFAGVDTAGANRPTGVSTVSWDVVQVGSTLYVAYDLTDEVRVRAFTSDAWQALDTGMTTSAPNHGIARTHITGSSARPIHLAVRGAGDYVVLIPGDVSMDMGSDFRKMTLFTFAGGTWTQRTPDGQAANVHYDSRALVLGASSRVHLFYSKSSAEGVFHRSIDSSNAYDTEGSTSGQANTSAYSAGLPTSYVDGANTRIVHPYATPTANFRPSVLRFISGANPTLSSESVNASVAVETITANPGVAVVVGTTAYVLYPDASTDDLWIDNDAGTGAWGTDVEIEDAVLVQGVSANYLSSQNAIGYVFNDNGVVKYGEHSLGAVNIQPPRTMHQSRMRRAA